MSKVDQPQKKNGEPILKTAVDLTVKIGVLLLILFFCFRILQPFINILLWALIIAIILYPLYHKLSDILGKRRKLAVIIITLLALALLLLPSYWLVNSVVESVKQIADNIGEGTFKISPPSEKVYSWPLVGPWLYDKWLQASENLGVLIADYLPQLSKLGERIFGSIANTGLGILQFAFSLLIAAFFLTISEKAARSGKRIFVKLAGERGEAFALAANVTIRNVALGVLGVAVIQSFLIGIPMFIIELPLAGIWIVIILILAVAQVPVMLLVLPLIIYLFAFRDPLPATLWTIYLLAASLVDNVLKPIIMGKGKDVPMLVIFLGAIGGFLAYGFLGLFLGAIILSLGYKLFLTWMEAD